MIDLPGALLTYFQESYLQYRIVGFRTRIFPPNTTRDIASTSASTLVPADQLGMFYHIPAVTAAALPFTEFDEPVEVAALPFVNKAMANHRLRFWSNGQVQLYADGGGALRLSRLRKCPWLRIQDLDISVLGPCLWWMNDSTTSVTEVLPQNRLGLELTTYIQFRHPRYRSE